MSSRISNQRYRVRKVIQRSDGAILSAGSTWWSYDLGEALEASEATWCPSEAQLVPAEVARDYASLLRTADLASLAA